MSPPRISTKAIWEGSISVVENGSPVDTSGITALKVVLQDMRSGREVMTGSLGSEVTAFDAPNGKYNFKFSVGQTSCLTPKTTYWFGAIVTDSEGDVRQLFRTRVTAYDGIVG